MTTPTGQRIFTIQKANQAVRELRRTLPALRRALRRAEQMEDRLEVLDLICSRAISPDNPDLQEYLSLRLRYHRAVSELDDRLRQLAAKGYLLRDLDKGVVHFRGRRAGKRVFLCWREGEAEISHWHARGQESAGEDQRQRIDEHDDF